MGRPEGHSTAGNGSKQALQTDCSLAGSAPGETSGVLSIRLGSPQHSSIADRSEFLLTTLWIPSILPANLPSRPGRRSS